MDTIKDLLSNKRNLVGLTVAVILLVALPVVLYLVRTQQIFKPKATGPLAPGTFNLILTTNTVPHYPYSVGVTANASVPGYELDRLEIWSIQADSFGNAVGSNWTQLPDSPFDCGGNDTCQFQVTDQYNTGDDGHWLYIMDVYYNDADNGVEGGLWCTGWQGNPNFEDRVCANGSGVVTAGSGDGGGGTDLNLTATLGNCSGSSRAVNLNWQEVDGASSYRVTADAATIGTVTAPATYFISNELVNSQRQFFVTALNSSGGQIVATNGSASIHVDPCSTTLGFSCSNLCSTPITGGTITSQGECYQQCLGSGTVNLVVNPSGTCNASNQTVVHLSWSPPPNTSGNSYQVLRDNIVIDVTSNLTKDDTTNPGTHTYRVNASSGNTPTGNGEETVNVTCTGGGTCRVVGPTAGTTGQSVGTYSVTGLPAGNYGCQWFVFGGTASYQPTQNCSFPFSFTPSSPGTYTVRSSAIISTTNTLSCTQTTVNVTGSNTGGYACVNNACVAQVGGILPAGCNNACGGGGGPDTPNCTATVTCSGPCVLSQPNTCNSGNGTATQCVYTTLSNGSTACTQVTAANSVCAAGDHCDSGNHCTISGGGTGGLCVPDGGGVTPPPSTTPPTSPTPTTPTRVKIANKLSTDTSCVSALASTRAYFRPVDGGQTTVELQHTLTDSAPGTKTVCAQFYILETPASPVLEESILLIGTPQVTPSPSATPPSCVTSVGDALIAGSRDGNVNLLDFNEWRDEFIYELSHGSNSSSRGADFNCQNGVTLIDFNIWRDEFIRRLGI